MVFVTYLWLLKIWLAGAVGHSSQIQTLSFHHHNCCFSIGLRNRELCSILTKNDFAYIDVVFICKTISKLQSRWSYCFSNRSAHPLIAREGAKRSILNDIIVLLSILTNNYRTEWRYNKDASCTCIWRVFTKFLVFINTSMQFKWGKIK